MTQNTPAPNPNAKNRYLLLGFLAGGVLPLMLLAGYFLTRGSSADGTNPATAPPTPDATADPAGKAHPIDPAPPTVAVGAPAAPDAAGGAGPAPIARVSRAPAARNPAPGRGPMAGRDTDYHGGIGLGTWDTTAEFKDVLVKTADKTLLNPDFNHNLDWATGAGNWDAAAGVLSQTARAIECRVTTGDPAWTNYTYTLKARRTDGTEGFLIIFAVENERSYVWWNLGGWGDTRSSIEQTSSGAKREISGTAVPVIINSNQWYDIRIDVHGRSFDCSLDGKLITTVDGAAGHSTLPDAGRPTIFNNGDGPKPTVTPFAPAASRPLGPAAPGGNRTGGPGAVGQPSSSPTTRPPMTGPFSIPGPHG